MRWVERRFVSPLRGLTGFQRCGWRDSVGWHPRLPLCQRYALPSLACRGDVGGSVNPAIHEASDSVLSWFCGAAFAAAGEGVRMRECGGWSGGLCHRYAVRLDSRGVDGAIPWVGTHGYRCASATRFRAWHVGAMCAQTLRFMEPLIPYFGDLIGG